MEETFGEEIAGLVDGVTKLTGLTFQSRDEAQAENYRKMVVAMATDIRVILVKLADRLHNMRTISAMSKAEADRESQETLDIYAPIAHRLGIHGSRRSWRTSAFATLHPRMYNELKELVAKKKRRARALRRRGPEDRRRAGRASASAPVISGRAKHFYSIYKKMEQRKATIDEIYDIMPRCGWWSTSSRTATALGVIHSLWKPIPGRFKDYIAMPKANMYQSLHTTVIGP